MFVGQYTHTLDNKRRISLPAKLRKLLDKDVMVTRGLDNCLWLYKMSDWKKLSEKIETLSFVDESNRGLTRFLHSGAQVEIDSSGRILLPEFLVKFSGIKSRIVLAGIQNRVEIWDEDKWKEYMAKTEENIDDLVSNISGL